MGEPNIGVIGLDKPGFALAACLARKGHRLLVRDADPTQGIRFVEEHATSRIATSDEDSFQHCNVVIINLANGNVAKELLLGQQGIAPHLKPGSLILDMGCSSALDTRALSLELSRLHVDLIDSPIAQNQPHVVEEGGATLLVGSDNPDALSKAMPLLNDASKHVAIVGELGAGHIMKTLTDYVGASRMVAQHGALNFGQKLGLKKEIMLDVFEIDTGFDRSTTDSMRASKSLSQSLETLANSVREWEDIMYKSETGTALSALETSRGLFEAFGQQKSAN